MSLVLYLLIGLTTASGLHWASAKSTFRNRSQRTILGASSGGLSYGVFSEWTSTVSILNASIAGDLSFYGFIFATGFFALCGVWGWNLFTTRKYLVQ
jgi:hypothetical protein